MENVTITRGMGKVTNASQAKAIFDQVPANKWIVGALGYSNQPGMKGMSCALGHLNRFVNKKGQLKGTGIPFNDPCHFGVGGIQDMSGFNKIVLKYLKSKGHDIHADTSIVPNINDEQGHYGYNQNTAQKRIMALVNDMIKAGF